MENAPCRSVKTKVRFHMLNHFLKYKSTNEAVEILEQVLLTDKMYQ